MRTSGINNIEHSVHQRLLNIARKQGRPFNELLQYYTIERFLYRLSESKYRNSFVLKGALLFFVWEKPGLRSTRDIDLLGLTNNSVDNVVRIVTEICQTDVVQDGIHFDFSGTILSEAISKTFNKRRTELPSNIDEFIRGLKSDPAKDRQWKGFIRKNKLEDAPSTLDDVLDAILSFLSSPVKKLTEVQAWKSE